MLAAESYFNGINSLMVTNLTYAVARRQQFSVIRLDDQNLIDWHTAQLNKPASASALALRDYCAVS